MTEQIKATKKLIIQKDIDDLCAERDSIMHNIVASSNKSEKSHSDGH